MELTNTPRKRRTWCYIMPPQAYEISCDICGGSHLNWSEYDHLIWCYDCEKDTPGTGGIFDGPIPLNLCLDLGLNFDKIDLSTGQRLCLTQTASGIIWEE